MRKLLIAISIMAMPSLNIAENAMQERMLDNLNVIKTIFEAKYAPGKYKATTFGWDLEEEISKVKDAILSDSEIGIKDYQKNLVKFFGSAYDYHVGAQFYSLEMAFLPFTVKSVEGHYYITEIFREKLSKRVFPIEVGDELISFDGKPPIEIVKQFIDFTPQSNAMTDMALADIFLTARIGYLGIDVPRGPVKISIRHAGSDQIKTYQLIWIYSPEKIQTGAFVQGPQRLSPDQSKVKLNVTNIKMESPLKELILAQNGKTGNWTDRWSDVEDEDNENILQYRSFVPPLGEIVWQTASNNPFHAYIYKNNERLIGYIRVPIFEMDEQDMPELANILAKMQAETEALVIDEVNNPGGYAFQMYAISSMLTDQPLFTPRHQLMITQEDVFEALMDIDQLEQVNCDEDAEALLGNAIFGYPVTYQFARFTLDYARFIVDEWNAGRKLTNPTYLGGIDYINPHPWVNYTKPILVLVNEMDFSAGDFFPAVLQDNKRATIFGTRTAGAGGAVKNITIPNRLGLWQFQITTSIAERIDQTPLENLGVTPDIPYDVTLDDMFNNYRGYVKAVNQAVEGLFDK